MYAAVAGDGAARAGHRRRLPDTPRRAPATSALFAYCELIDAAMYLNHYWYLTLALTLVVVLPLSERWSLDARPGRVPGRPTVPAAVVWVLRAQLAVVYVMAGLAKLNADWLVRGEPMGTWLASRTDLPVVGPLLDEPWAGPWPPAGPACVFDLTIVGWLLWRRTPSVAYVAVIVFHVVTWRLFAIGVFPWVMLAGTLIFFPPDWPTALGDRGPDRRRRRRRRCRPECGGGRWIVAGLAGWALVQAGDPAAPPRLPRRRPLDRGGLLRLVPGDAHREGRVAALRGHRPGDRRDVDRRPGRRCSTDWQERQAATRADLTLAAAHLVAAEMAARRASRRRGARRLVGVVQRPSPPAHDRPVRRPRRAVAACPGVGVRPAARLSADSWTDARLAGLPAIALAVPIVAAVGVAVVALDRRRRAGRPGGADVGRTAFDSLDELVAASDLVVVGTVAGVADGRVLTAPDRPDAGFRTRLVELDVERTLAGEPPTPLVVEEPAELLDGTPVVVDGMAPLDVGDRAVWFLVAGGSDEQPYHAVVNGQGRYEIIGATLRPSG